MKKRLNLFRASMPDIPGAGKQGDIAMECSLVRVCRGVLAFVVCFFGIQSAWAAGNVLSTIATVRTDVDGKGIIEFSQTIGGSPPTCVATGFNLMMSFNANTAGGRAILAVALVAKASGSQVLAVGGGTCNLYSNTIEDLVYLEQR